VFGQGRVAPNSYPQAKCLLLAALFQFDETGRLIGIHQCAPGQGGYGPLIVQIHWRLHSRQMGSMATHKEVSQLELLEKRLSGVAELRYRMLYGKAQFITAFISATYTIHKESKHILTSKSPSQS